MIFEHQKERDALINLMLLARYVDKSLSIAENDTFENILGNMQWQDVIKPHSRVNEYLLGVRHAAQSDETIEHFLNEQCGYFQTNEAKQIALKKIDNILQSDGLVDVEKNLYKTIKAKLEK